MKTSKGKGTRAVSAVREIAGALSCCQCRTGTTYRVGCLFGCIRHRRYVAHLASGSRLRLSVEMKTYVWYIQGTSPIRLTVLPNVTKKICHRRRAVKRGRTERQTAHRPKLLFELGHHTRIEREMAGVVRPRS